MVNAFQTNTASVRVEWSDSGIVSRTGEGSEMETMGFRSEGLTSNECWTRQMQRTEGRERQKRKKN